MQSLMSQDDKLNTTSSRRQARTDKVNTRSIQGRLTAFRVDARYKVQDAASQIKTLDFPASTAMLPKRIMLIMQIMLSIHLHKLLYLSFLKTKTYSFARYKIQGSRRKQGKEYLQRKVIII